MELFDQIEQLAVANLLFALKHSPDDNGTFKTLVTMNAGSIAKPLLLVGNAHHAFQDGHVIAVLNPDEDLIRELSAGCGYGSAQLKEIVAQRCDCMVDIHVIGADTQPNIRRGGRYKMRHTKPAKFVVR